MSTTEGSGGAPLAWFLRCDTSNWEVPAASRFRAWLRFEGYIPLVDYEEGAWMLGGLEKPEQKLEEEARRRAEAAELSPD